MGRVRSWLSHAFAVDPPGPAVPSPAEAAAVDRLCQEIARRHLTTPALMALEMSRPLNYLAAQALQFFAPAVWALVRRQTHESYTAFAAFLERRGSVDHLASRIEHFEALHERREASAGAPPEETPPA